MAWNKNFVKSNIREKVFADWWTLRNIEINVEDLKRLPVNEHWFVRLTMQKRKDVWKYGETHYLYENTYNSQWVSSSNQVSKVDSTDDLPF